MKILITGGNGMVGKNLQDITNNKPSIHSFYYITSDICDLKNNYNVDQLFKMYNPDVVIHLASLVAGLYGNMNNNYKFFSDNIKINTNILDSCKKYKIKRLINVLSTCIFPKENVIYPLTSDQILNGPPDESNEGYAYSKRVLYNGSKILSKNKDTVVINLIPTNLYGKYDNFNIENGHVLPTILNKMFIAKRIGNDLIINGNGEAIRQFIYASDFAKIIYDFIEIKPNERLVGNSNFISCIISPNESKNISINNLIETLKEKMEFTGNIIYKTDMSNGQHLKTTSDDELKMFFPDIKLTSLSDGIDEVIKYVEENYNDIRK